MKWKNPCRRFPALLAFFFVLFAAAAPQARAEEAVLYEKSGADRLYQSLDQDARDLLGQAGVREGRVQELDGQGLLRGLGRALREKLAAPLKAAGALLGIILLCRLCGCFEEGGFGAQAGAIACGAVMAAPLLGLLSACETVSQTAGAFITAAVPVYAGLLTASGSPAAGSGYSFLAMGAGAAVPWLCAGFLLPLLRVYLALAVSAAASGGRLGKLADSLYRFGKWALGLAVTAYTGVLSVQTALNGQIDAAAGKAAKLALSSGVPIVGGALGDAVAAIQNSVHMVKSGAGAFGMLAGLCLFLPLIGECAAWAGVCFLGEMAGDLFEAPEAGRLMGAFGGVVKMVLAVVASVCAVCVVTGAVVVFAAN